MLPSNAFAGPRPEFEVALTASTLPGPTLVPGPPTVEGAFHAPRRLSPRAPSAPSAPRNPTAAQARVVGEDFEEDGADWRVLTVEWDAGLGALVVWYYDADMAADANLTEDDMHLARTEGVDLGPLECSGIAEVKKWIRDFRSA